MTATSFDPHASSVRVPVYLEGRNRWLMSLVLDTGASRTVLGLDVLRFFNVTLDFERGQLTLVRIRPGQVRETTPAYQAPPAWAA